MNFVINLLAKWSGANAVWTALDGKKTLIAGVLGVLSGLAGVGAEVYAPITAHDAAALLGIIRGLPADPAWIMLVGSLGALGIGHKLAKAADAAAPVVPPAA